MRSIRRLLLVVAGLVAALALVPSGASAQSVEVSQESGGHCDATVEIEMLHHRPADEPACSLHAVSEGTATSDLFQHTGLQEAPFSVCSNEFEGVVSETGHVWVYDQVLTPEGNPCGREPCDETEGTETPHRNLAWEGQISEEGPNTAEREILEVEFCLRTHAPNPEMEGSGTPCRVDLTVQRIGTGHDLHITSPPHDGVGNGGAPCINLGGAVELEGSWETFPNENHPDRIEIHHLDDEAG